MKKLWQLFYTFAIVGVTTFGGGYAMLPALQREVVEKRGWATEEELMDWYAIGQCTPGVIAVNTATFAGQKQAGAASSSRRSSSSRSSPPSFRALRTSPPCSTPLPASAPASAS